MMMVQTAIHAALYAKSDLTPSQLLQVINKAITENIKKLDEDKYMTLTVMACHENGQFHFSGCHQDILIFRANSQNVDLIPTGGMWIGIVDDITDMIQIDTLEMNTGDVMLLYTDGITEAIDTNKQLYSDEKLVKVFKNLGKKNPDEIKQGILNSLKAYTCSDDVTLMVLKKI